MTTVLLVDDHDIVRTGVGKVLSEQPDIEVVAEAGTGEEAVRLAREHRPDVVLMDVNMPGGGGMDATRRINKQELSRVIILTVHAEAPYPTRLLEAGADGYLTKGCDSEELISAVRSVASGRKFIGRDIAHQLALGRLPGSEQSPFDALTARELTVAMLVVQGADTAKIANTMSIALKTVSAYKARIYDKLDVRNAVMLTRLAIRHGLAETD